MMVNGVKPCKIQKQKWNSLWNSREVKPSTERVKITEGHSLIII